MACTAPSIALKGESRFHTGKHDLSLSPILLIRQSRAGSLVDEPYRIQGIRPSVIDCRQIETNALDGMNQRIDTGAGGKIGSMVCVLVLWIDQCNIRQ